MTARSLATIAILLVAWLPITLSSVAPAFAQTSPAQREARNAWPGYPLWLAKLLAPFGIAGAQALAGYQALAYDPCNGFNWLLSASQQHNLFAE